MAKDLEYYLAQARRIAEHREASAEKEIRKLYKAMLKDLQQFMSETYVRYAEEDKLTFGMLQKAGYDARFLEEIEQRINLATPQAAQALRRLIEQTYEAAYNEMVKGVARNVPLDEAFAEAVAITPEQIRRAVENPVSGLTLSDTLEKNRRDIIYSIKRSVGVGLMNGDRYTTVAKRIAEYVDGDYKKAVSIARTETHRVREAGNADAAVNVDKELQNGTTGYRMVKVWKTMKDERVRPQQRRKTKKGWKTTRAKGGANHVAMEGQTVLANEKFMLGNGVEADAPGNSGDAGNDINCRCYASYRMMTDEEFFKATGRHFPGEDKKLLRDIEGTELYDEIKNDLEMYVGGGYSSPAEALGHDKTKLKYITDSMTPSEKPLYRVEEARFTLRGQSLRVGKTFSFEDDLRSFTRSKEYADKLLDPYGDMWFDEPVVFETVGTTRHFNMDNFAEAYIENQSESLVGGTFEVLGVQEKTINGSKVTVVRIKQKKK